jgi:peptidoglycan hydrolase-like protein with peptidoglycan-binding domain
MEKIKFILLLIVVLALIGLIGYWSINTMQSGSENVINEKIKQLEDENTELKNKTKNLTEELTSLQSKLEENILSETENIETPTETTKPISVYKNQKLIEEIQKLINDKIYMKLKSSGTRVGTIQEFLNIYNKTSNKIDNDYGVSTKKLITAFQKDQRLKADGEAGAGTFTKMIEWLKKQN